MPRAKFAPLEPEKAQLRQNEALRKDDRVQAKEREDKLCDREDYVEDQELSENKKNKVEPARKHWKRKNTKSSPKDRLKKDEDEGIVFDRDTMDKRATIGRACSRTAGSKKNYRGTASKLTDKTRS